MYEELLVKIDRDVNRKKWLTIITCVSMVICMLIITTIITIAEISRICVFSYHMDTLVKGTGSEYPEKDCSP